MLCTVAKCNILESDCSRFPGRQFPAVERFFFYIHQMVYMEQAALGSFCSLVIGQQLFFLTCHNIADSQCASLSRPQACSVSGVGGQNIDQQGLAGSLCNSLGQFRLFLVYFIAEAEAELPCNPCNDNLQGQDNKQSKHQF